jgi:hypothetical protein
MSKPDKKPAPASQPAAPKPPSKVLSQDKFNVGPKLRQFLEEHSENPKKPQPKS